MSSSYSWPSRRSRLRRAPVVYELRNPRHRLPNPVEQDESGVSSTVIDETADRGVGRASGRATCCASRPASRSRRAERADARRRCGSAAPKPITLCSSSTASSVNDPAGGNVPRFEMLNADGLADRDRARAAIGLVGIGSDRRRDRGRKPGPRSRGPAARRRSNMARSTSRAALGLGKPRQARRPGYRWAAAISEATGSTSWRRRGDRDGYENATFAAKARSSAEREQRDRRGRALLDRSVPNSTATIR